MAIAYNPKIVTNGLVGYWDAGNTKSYPGSGSTWYDLSGNNNHGSLISSPTFSNGALNFNGTSQYVDIPFNTANMPSGSSARTCITTFNASSLKDTPLLGVGTNGISGSRSSLFLTASGTLGTDFINQASVFGTVTYSTGSWYQVAFSLPAGGFTTTTRMFLNGVEFAVTGGQFYTFNTSTSKCVIGTIPDYAFAPYFFNGLIANSMLYNRDLSATEIAQNFKAIRGRFNL